MWKCANSTCPVLMLMIAFFFHFLLVVGVCVKVSLSTAERLWKRARFLNSFCLVYFLFTQPILAFFYLSFPRITLPKLNCLKLTQYFQPSLDHWLCKVTQSSEGLSFSCNGNWLLAMDNNFCFKFHLSLKSFYDWN